MSYFQDMGSVSSTALAAVNLLTDTVARGALVARMATLSNAAATIVPVTIPGGVPPSALAYNELVATMKTVPEAQRPAIVSETVAAGGNAVMLSKALKDAKPFPIVPVVAAAGGALLLVILMRRR